MFDIIKTVASNTKAQEGVNKIDPQNGEGTGLTDSIKMIINGVIGIIGAVAVIMIIIGGVNYTTSQGDPGKVKKAKDTILYGIIGLVIALLAFAIVNFVLGVFVQQS